MLFPVAVKPSSGRILVGVLSALGAAVGCGGGHPLQVGGDGSSQGGRGGSAGRDGGADAVTVCRGLDEATCTATVGCTAGICPTCYGHTRVEACYRPAVEAAPVCIALPCALPSACGELDETSCSGRTDCQTLFCPDCKGGRTFTSCAVQGSGGTCPPSCPQPPSCTGLDEKSCTATPGCSAQNCSTCGLPPVFSACYRKGETPPICIQIPCPHLPPCAVLDETSCNARADCQADYCTGCSRRTFVGCGEPGTGFACPAGCAVPGPCASETTLAGCATRTDCHAVFIDHGICDCAVAGCCTSFDHCADRDKASCKWSSDAGASLCMRIPPACEAPPYVVSYTSTCYEGCVQPKDCAP
jgi:hypothetical protein